MADRRVSVKIDADISPYSRALSTLAVETRAWAKELESADGRLANLVQTGAALAPALVPLGAAAVPAIAGLTLQLGLAAGAAGVAVLAFHGVGDALKALDNYRLDPTAKNFEKLQQQMGKIGPAGQEFVLALEKMKPHLQELQDVAQAGLFPGVTDGLHEFLALAPQAKDIIFTLATTLGDLTREGAKGLDDAGMRRFFAYIENTARPVLTEMGHTFGNFIEGLANVIVAFDPLSRSFSTGMLNISRAFKESTANLDQKHGFQDFVQYVQESGPRALDALESIGNAFVQLVEAAAPVGSAVLPVISDLADVLAKIADSPVGPLLIGAAAAVGTLGRSLAILKAVGLRGGGDSLIGRILDPGKIKAGAVALGTVTTASDRARLSVAQLTAAEKERNATVRAGALQLGKTVGLVSGLALATTGLADKTGLSNTASLALMGTIAGPWGAAIGAGVGLLQDARAANDAYASSIDRSDRLIKNQSTSLGELTANRRALLTQLDKDTSLHWYDLLNPSKSLPVIAKGLGGAYGDMLGQIHDVGAAADIKRWKDMAAQQSLLRDGFELTAAGASDAARSVDEFSIEVTKANNVLTKHADLREYQAALDDFADTLERSRKSLKPGQKLVVGGKLNIDLSQGRDVEAALERIAGDAFQAAKSLHGIGREKYLDHARDQFIKAARSIGLTRKQARSLANQLKLLDRMNPTINMKVKLGDAKHAVDSFIADISSRTAYLSIKGKPSGGLLGAGLGNARGNFLPSTSYAYGGIDAANRHMPELAGPGPTRIWREPETGGESYIPHANDFRRPRAMAILDQTADLFGGRVVYNAHGSYAARASESEWVRAKRFAAGGYRGAAPVNVHPSVRLPALEVSVNAGDLSEVISVEARWAAEEAVADHADMVGMSRRAGGGG